MIRPHRPQVAVLTAAGTGAIGAVGVRGAGAVEVVDSVFRGAVARAIESAGPGKPRLGRIGPGAGDEVVAVVTGTDPPAVEVYCHGGTAAVAMVREELLAAGCEVGDTSQWLVPARATRSQADAWNLLPRAKTGRTAAILLDQAQGAFDRCCMDIAARVTTDPARCRDQLERWIRTRLPLVDGAIVVLAGRPNVGKSRLMNALAGYERSIVGDEAGTTRDLVRASSAFDGWPVELIDAAGERFSHDAADPVEVEGVRRAVAARATASVVVLVLDRSDAMEDADRRLLAALPGAVRVANKCDREAAWPATETGFIEVSALLRDGLDTLIRAIVDRIVPEPVGPGGAVVLHDWQRGCLQRAISALDAGCADQAAAILEKLAQERVGTVEIG
jgi:tRNA modification GTPase